MNYGIYKLRFPYGVHFGNRMLENCNIRFCADTLFSALCVEALKNSNEELLNKFVDQTRKGNLLFSDAFPYVGEEYLLPKPYIQIVGKEQDSAQKKKYKKLNYVALSQWQQYASGNLDLSIQEQLEKNIGDFSMRTYAAVRGLEETLPYRVSSFSFSEGAGLYLVYGYENDEDADLFYELLEKLSFTGIGGKKSSGYGRFEIYNGKMPKEFQDSLVNEAEKYVSLSVCLPKEDELEAVMESSTYSIEKRSGFIDSTRYASSMMRKKDIFLFSSGSTFASKFEGDIYDVSSGGNHPVYKYAKPFFMGVL